MPLHTSCWSRSRPIRRRRSRPSRSSASGKRVPEGTAGGLSARTWSAGSCSRCSTSASTNCRASPTRSSSTPAPYESGLSPDTSTVGLGVAVQEGKIAGGAGCRGDRSQARGAAWLRSCRARSRQEADHRVLRARLQRSATRRRAGPTSRSTSITSSRTSRAQASSTSAIWCRACSRESRPQK